MLKGKVMAAKQRAVLAPMSKMEGLDSASPALKIYSALELCRWEPSRGFYSAYSHLCTVLRRRGGGLGINFLSHKTGASTQKDTKWKINEVMKHKEEEVSRLGRRCWKFSKTHLQGVVSSGFTGGKTRMVSLDLGTNYIKYILWNTPKVFKELSGCSLQNKGCLGSHWF